ncbi:MAG: histidine kinase [Actinobacteria bacterium]|nr:histidine kinase [Actinomycetota bacterium]
MINNYQKDFLIKIIVPLLVGTVFGAALIFLIIRPNHVFKITASQLGILFSLGALVFAIILFVFYRFKDEPDHLRALLSHQILEIANRTLPYFRMGLTYESASKVAQIIWKGTDAIAVAITDNNTVLAFRGIGENHHRAGETILTKSTRDALEHNEVRVLESKKEIGCPVSNCPLEAAIIVPLVLRKKPVGSLKFYYANQSKLTESHITLAEGLARLLSTQLELSEIDKQAELAHQAELKALQAQINPHFLFNTLNTIAMFCRTKPAKARKLLIQFADFFRKSLERESDLVTLSEELDYVNSYLVFEEARFGDRLKIVENIDPLSLSVRLPALTLQPVVENSVKHGAPANAVLEVIITTRVSSSELLIEVKDNGVGISSEDMKKILLPGFGKGIGVGLHNVNERLESLYGKEYHLDIKSAIGQGTTVKLKIPLFLERTLGVASEA